MSNEDPNAMLKPIDELIDWWKANADKISADPNVTKKCKEMIPKLENYRSEAYNRLTELVQIRRRIAELDKLNKSDPALNKRHADALRELNHFEDNSGHVMQAYAIKWFHEDTISFTVKDVEVRDPNPDPKPEYDFDIEIADSDGDSYDAEVWLGKSRVAHGMVDTSTQYLVGSDGKPLHIDEGKVPEDKEDIMSDLGGADTDPERDWPKAKKKLDQLRDNHVGFLLAFRSQYPPRIFQNIPLSWGSRLQKNKCIIALYMRSMEFGKRGFGYIVPHPQFKHAEIAKRIITSLGFEYAEYEPTPLE